MTDMNAADYLETLCLRHPKLSKRNKAHPSMNRNLPHENFAESLHCHALLVDTDGVTVTKVFHSPFPQTKTMLHKYT